MGIISRFIHKTTTDVVELLTAQHAEVDELFSKIEQGEGNPRTVFLELADKLAAHATVEEKIFYPAVMAKSTKFQLLEAAEEHLQIKRLLADIITMDLDDARFEAKIMVLKEEVSHHAHKEEEKKLFPEVRAMFDADERAALGGECLAMFEELMKSHPYRNVPAETADAAALPKV